MNNTQDIDPMLDHYRAAVVDGGSTLVQHWVDVFVFACMRHKKGP